MIPSELAHGVKMSINKSIKRLLLHAHKDFRLSCFHNSTFALWAIFLLRHQVESEERKKEVYIWFIDLNGLISPFL
jgi:hypothetical protein